MKDVIDKISSYNIFNYLFPGIIFAAVGSQVSSFYLLLDDIVIGVFVYYLYGMVISRIGSLALEPVLKLTKFVHLAPYSDFVIASRTDTTVSILSEQNNTYRTLASLFICLLLLILFDTTLRKVPVVSDHGLVVGLALLAVLFAFAFRKQTKYISQRVAAINTQAPDSSKGS